MSKSNEHLARLIAGHLRQELGMEEKAVLNDWMARRPENRRFVDSLEDAENLQQKLKVFHEVNRGRLWALTEAKLAQRGIKLTQSPVRRMGKWLPYAAALLVGVAVAVWSLSGEQHHQVPVVADQQILDIPAGGNRATLTLADGRTINLDEDRDGIIVGGNGITYNDGNPLADVGGDESATQLALTTPKGGIYQVTLPDGTQVWLNAASTLRYPSRFSASERVVELIGEAYFSVKKDANRPFKVISSAQEIQVLGTAFNVSAYPDDSETRTTLVEGKVQLSINGDPGNGVGGHIRLITLVPGEQGVNNGKLLTKTKVDTALYTAWKSGYFFFKRTPLEEILRQAARWYDIEVIYEKGVPTETFSGDIRRDVSLRGLLDILQHSTINVSLEGRVLTVHGQDI